jgi:hypothetical protein
MLALHPTRLALTAALALAAGAARGATVESGVCIALSGGAHVAVADAAARAVGVGSLRVDVEVADRKALLSSHCGKLVIAVGPEALRLATELAPGTPTIHVFAGSARGAARAMVSADADPRHVFETLQAMAPKARRIGAVFDPALTGELVAEAQAAARVLGLELVALPAKTVGEAVRAFYRFEVDLRVDALWLLPDGTATVQETVYYALELAHWKRMAVVGLSRWYVASGALFALVPKPASLGAAAGELGQRLLRGEQPAEVVRVRDYSLFVNQRSAAQLGLKLTRQLLDGAEQVLP